MTDTIATETLTEALTLIDQGLAHVQHRSLVSATEVADLLLDVRLLLAAPPDSAADLADVARRHPSAGELRADRPLPPAQVYEGGMTRAARERGLAAFGKPVRNVVAAGRCAAPCRGCRVASGA